MKVGRCPPFLLLKITELKLFINMEHTLQERIAAIVEPSLQGMGYGLVQVRLMESSHRRTLQIMAERTDGKNMTVDDCAAISHQVSALLDVEDPIAGAYSLEISSPGIDRPLIKRADFEKFLGYDAKMESKLPIDGRKRFKGVLTAVEGDDIVMATEQGTTARVALHNLHSAKLLLTDKLIERYQNNETTH